MAFTERYYQREARAALDSGFFEYKSGLLHLGTGAGKTSIVAKDIEANAKARCLFLGDQDELIMQPLRAIQRVGGVIAALEQAKNRAPHSARVVVGSSQTFSRKARRERFRPDHFDRIYVDEAHRGAKRDKEITNYFETAQVCGMTATPFTSSLRDLSKFYETVFYSKPMLNLCEEGFAPPMEIFHLPVEIDLDGVEVAKGEYTAEAIDSTITPKLLRIAKVFADYAKTRHTLAYLPLIKTSMAFAAALRSVGVTARHVDGTSHDRQQILEAFARGEFAVLCNAGVVGTGVDLPIADCFLNLTPMRSMSEYQQRAGRSLRPWPGLIDHLPEREQAAERCELIAWSEKPNALMFDLLWQHDELGCMSPAHLVATSEEEAKAMMLAARRQMTPEDLLALQKRVQAEKEQQLARALERAAIKADVRKAVPFSQAAHLIGRARLLSYEPVARWELQLPSDPQRNLLANFGVDPNTVESKGAASKLLDELVFRRKNRFATIKQIKLLLRINETRDPEARIPEPHRLTVTEAAAEIDKDIAARASARLLAA